MECNCRVNKYAIMWDMNCPIHKPNPCPFCPVKDTELKDLREANRRLHAHDCASAIHQMRDAIKWACETNHMGNGMMFVDFRDELLGRAGIPAIDRDRNDSR